MNEIGLGKKLLDRCRDHAPSSGLGGATVDNAVKAVFAALLWHTQTLREDLEKIGN